MNKKKVGMIILKVFLVLVLAVVFLTQSYVYANSYDASRNLDSLVDESEYRYENKMYIFEPEVSNGKALLFYNGALVDPYSYAYTAKTLADEGYLVILPKFFNNISMINASKGHDIIAEYDEYEWYVGGHSLGGVSASSLLDGESDIAGIIYLASYPSAGIDLSDQDIEVLSITASADGVINMENYNEAKDRLPSDTTYEVIEKGNHANFGMYGDQRGDKRGGLTPHEQQDILNEIILNWLNDK